MVESLIGGIFLFNNDILNVIDFMININFNFDKNIIQKLQNLE